MKYFRICSPSNIVFQTVIPGHRQSLGATERRSGHFRITIYRIIGNREANCSTQKEWGEFPPTTMIHLNSQVRQFGGFTHGPRVLGRTPKMPIGAVVNPHFLAFVNPKDAETTKTHHLLGIIRQFRQASSTAYFNGGLNLRLNRGFLQFRNEEL